MEPEKTSVNQMHRNLRPECKYCFGLCCAALGFAQSDGFPADKPAGEACTNLQKNFSCGVYGELKNLGLKGCTVYDCFGAGQRVAKTTYGGVGWRENPESKEQMFRVFGVMQELHEIMWYLCEAHTLLNGKAQAEAENLLHGLEIVAQLRPEQLLELDMDKYREKASMYIKRAGEEAQKRVSGGLCLYPVQTKSSKRRINLMGADLKMTDLVGADLRGAYLIATDLRGVDLSYADMLGADMRDANIRGADLSKSVFLTQMQVNAAKGNTATKLPEWIQKPRHWNE